MRFPSEKVVGIYKIINTINDKYYVGSSNFISKRWTSHRSYLNRNVHVNDYLQNAWNKYKEEGFVFLVVGKLPVSTTNEELLIVTSKHYSFISPSNEIVNIQNLKEFCIINKLNKTCMYDIHSGKKYRHTHKGWRKA